MNTKQIAQSYFNRITSGHRNPVQRPDPGIPGTEGIDRTLRNLVEDANHNGDCIINIGRGYYRPVAGDPVDELELKEYLKKDEARERKLKLKRTAMLTAFENWRKEATHSEQQKEGRSGGTGVIKAS